MAQDPYRYFRVEARELLDQLGKAVLDIEQDPSRTDLPPLLLRLAHTLKGAARVVRQSEIADLSHALEDVLAPYRAGDRPVPRDRIDKLLSTLDRIGEHVARLPGSSQTGSASAEGPAEEQVRVLRAEADDVDRLIEGLGEVQGELAPVRRCVSNAARARAIAEQLDAQLAPRFAQEGSTEQAMKLAKARALADRLLRAFVGLERDVAQVERVDRELHQAREHAERLRLVPFGTILGGLQRLARDSAQKAGKHVSFHAEGTDVRMDGDVLDSVRPALVQLVLNAVVHGIEPPDERRRSGKPQEGRISLEVERRAGHVSFRCRDDGRGVDLGAVRDALSRKGALPAGARGLGAAELLRLLLGSGITTSRTVTGLAGRGIGLDLVRQAASRLGGEASVQTATGSGTAIELRVPVRLASLDALIVDLAGASAALPLSAVRGAVRVPDRDVNRGPEGEAIAIEGTLLPLLSVGGAGVVAGAGPRAQGRRGGEPTITALKVAGAGRTVALAVDRIRGVKTVLLRPLPPAAPVAAYVSGIYLDTEGDPRPVLDPEALADPAMRPGTVAPPAQRHAAPILVIDDSLTTRMLEQSILESAGYEVALAGTAEQGLEMARRGRYGLFLVDVEMPGMDGFAFVERTRADPDLRDIPCILVTSRVSVEDRERGAAAGAGGYIVKSEFDQADFLERVAALLRR